MEFCKRLEETVSLLKTECNEARAQGYSTVTLTSDEITEITDTLSLARRKVLNDTDTVISDNPISNSNVS